VCPYEVQTENPVALRLGDHLEAGRASPRRRD
jgi:hypothetical protein